MYLHSGKFVSANVISREDLERELFLARPRVRGLLALCAHTGLKGTEQPMTDKSSFVAGKFDSISPSFGRRVAA